MRRSVPVVALGVVMAAGSTMALAAPLDVRVVSPDATWVVHLDAEAALASTVGRYVLEHAGEVDIAPDEFAGMDQEMALGIIRDLRGVTIYGAGEDVDRAVAVVQTGPAADALVNLARLDAKEVAELNEAGRTLTTWRSDDDRWWVVVSAPAGVGDRIIITSEDKSALMAGLSVMLRDQPARGGHPLVAQAPRRGSILFAASNGPLPGDDDTPAFLREAQGAVVDIGEALGEMYADFTMKARNEEDAENMVQAASGLVAIARMAMASDPAAQAFAGLLNSVGAKRERETVQVTARWNPQTLIDAIKAAEAASNNGEPDEDEAHTNAGVRIEVIEKAGETAQAGAGATVRVETRVRTRGR